MKNIKSFSCYFVAALSLAIMPFAQAANRTISANYTLTANEDWTGKTVDIASGVTVNLNGYLLQIGSVGVIGEGSSPVFTGTSGELRISVPEGKSFANPGWSVEGSVDVVKDGAGLFSWDGGTIAATAPISVVGGVFRVGVTTANVFGDSGDIYVSGKGQFDINFGGSNSSPIRNRTFYIEGGGPDGTGAIVNNASGNGAAYHLNYVFLTGDATIGGVSRIDFRGGAYGIDAGGHELTIKNTSMLALCQSSSCIKNCTDIVIDGGVFQPCKPCIIEISGRVILKNGGVLASWAPTKSDNTQNLDVSIVVLEGGGTIKKDNYYYEIGGSITVKSGNTLNCPTEGPWYSGVITNEIASTINIGGDFFATGGIFKNDGTVIHTAGKFYFGSRDNQKYPCRVENNGVFCTTGGNFYFRNENSAIGNGVFDLAGSTAIMEGDLSGFEGTVRLSGGTASLSSISNFGGTLVLAGGIVSTSLSDVTCPVVFDLSEKTEPFTIPESWLTLPENKLVTIDISERRLVWGEKLLSWTSVPSLEFSLSDNSALLVEKEDGLYFGDCDIVPVSATWTGAANNGLFSDVANWTCLDEKGDSVAAFPAVSTTIKLGADVPQGGWATFDLARQTGVIDLNGHRAVLQPPSGNSPQLEFIDTSTDTSHPGELHFTIGEGVSYTNTDKCSISGNLSLVKDGPGLFVWGGGTLAATIPITVTDGVFRLGVTTANVFGEGGTITVAGTGQFDINYGTKGGRSPVCKRTFYIEGEGPDGSGAIYNSATANEYGYHLERVIMTGDATIGGVSRMDFRGGGIGIDGVGYTLTIKNQACLAFCGGNAHLKCKDLVIADGGVFQPCQGNITTSSINISGFIILRDGGVFESYNDRSDDPKVFNAPVIVGEGGGVIRSAKYSYQMNGSVTVSAGNTLTIGAGTVTMTSLTLNQGATVEISDASANLSVTGEFVNNGTVKLSDGTVSFPDGGSFGGTLFFEGGKVASSLAGFTGTMVVDVSKLSEPLDVEGRGWFTLAYGKEVLVDTGSRDLQFGDRLLSWTSLPLGVRFRLVGDFPGVLRKDANGVVYGNYPGLKLIVR